MTDIPRNKLPDLFDTKYFVTIRVGDEVRCDRAILLANSVRIRRDGVWIELHPPNWNREGSNDD